MAVASRSIFNTVNRSLKHKQILSRSLLFLSRPPSISASRGPLIAYRGFCDTCPFTLERFMEPLNEEEDFSDTGHYMVCVEKPSEQLTRDQIIDSYINILALAVGSEDEAKKKIFTVDTKMYSCFGALLPDKKVRDKLKGLPGVERVSRLGINNRKFGEPFINGKAVPYDPKYYADDVRVDQTGYLTKYQISNSAISKDAWKRLEQWVAQGRRLPINLENKDKDSEI